MSKSVRKDPESLLAELRSGIAALQAERSALLETPIPEAEALGRLDSWIELHRDRFRCGAIAAFTAREEVAVPNWIPSQFAGGNTVHFGNVEHALVWLSPESVRAAFAGGLSKYYSAHPGIDDGTRDQRLTQIDEELFKLEIDEECVIDQAEQTGLYFPRRGDADPRALVAAST